MSPARLHRERLATAQSRDPSTPIVAPVEGGRTSTPAPLPPQLAPSSPARKHQLATVVAAAQEGGDAIAAGVDPVAAQIQLRLSHDLRRLKEIQSIERKIDAKRDMLPDYRDWCDALLSGGDDRGGVAEDVLPTMMVWSIDTGDWPRALALAGYVLRHDVPLPSRYERTAPALIAEEIATAALKVQAAGEAFPLAVLEDVDALTAGADMHDQIRAKLMKAIGLAWAAQADGRPQDDEEGTAERLTAINALLQAQRLHDRVGVKDKIKRLEKAVQAASAQQE